VPFTTRLTAYRRATLYLGKMQASMRVDSQEIRAKLLRRLEGLFDLAISVAKGKVKTLVDESGKKHTVTFKERQMWGRLAAYTAQVMQNLSQGFDEKEFRINLKRLEEMVHEIEQRRKAEEKNRTDASGRT
jgi:hypothetical protein